MRASESASGKYPRRIAEPILALMLFLSGMVGAWIVSDDRWLRAVSPSHAYGLLAFAAFDLGLLLVILVVRKLAYVGALFVSMAQLIAMLGDAFTFAPTGTPQAAFRAYLLGDPAFVALLGIQLAVGGMTAVALAMPGGLRHGVYPRHTERLKS